MSCDLEKEIRELAYQKWVTAGCPLTSEEERNNFWLNAEQEIKSKQQEVLSVKSVSNKKPSAKGRKK